MLVTIRNPVDGLFSYYCEMTEVGAARDCPTFESFVRNSNAASVYKLSELVTYVRDLFGIVPSLIKFELLLDHRQQYFAEVARWLDAPVIDFDCGAHGKRRNKTSNGVLITPISKAEQVFRKIALKLGGNRLLGTLISRNTRKYLFRYIKSLRRPVRLNSPTKQEIKLVHIKFGSFCDMYF